MKSPEENGEEFLELLSELKGRLVIVEGKRDESALRKLGLRNIMALNGTSPSAVASGLFNSGMKGEVVILTDFDKEGRELAKELRRVLEAYKIKVNSRLRMELRSFGKGRVEDFYGVEIE